MFLLSFVQLFYFVNALEEKSHAPTNGKCWGYEKNCDFKDSLSSQNIKCSNPEDVSKFFLEADFGYVQKRINSLQTLCKSRPGSRAPGQTCVKIENKFLTPVTSAGF